MLEQRLHVPWLAVTIGLGLSLPAMVSGQMESSGWDEVGGREFAMLGYHSLDLNALNSRLAGAGFPESSTHFFTIGAAEFKTKGPVLLGVEGHYVVGSDERIGDTETRIGGGQIQFTLGYNAYSTGSFSIYPAVGIGGAGINFDLVERGEVAFDDILTDPKRSARITSFGFLLDASVGLEYRPGFASADEPGEDGLLIGIRTGYTFAPGDTSLKRHDKDDVVDGPDLGLQGFYVRFSIGGWGRREAADETAPEGR